MPDSTAFNTNVFQKQTQGDCHDEPVREPIRQSVYVADASLSFSRLHLFLLEVCRQWLTMIDGNVISANGKVPHTDALYEKRIPTVVH